MPQFLSCKRGKKRESLHRLVVTSKGNMSGAQNSASCMKALNGYRVLLHEIKWLYLLQEKELLLAKACFKFCIAWIWYIYLHNKDGVKSTLSWLWLSRGSSRRRAGCGPGPGGTLGSAMTAWGLLLWVSSATAASAALEATFLVTLIMQMKSSAFSRESIKNGF